MGAIRTWRRAAVLVLLGAGVWQARGDAYDLVSRQTGNPGYAYFTSPGDWRDINMYQLFTDRFFDGNSGNNLARSSTLGVPWYNQTGSNAENDRHLFQGGDWAGIKQKLPYLKGMGVNCIWISGVQMNEQGTDKRFTPYHAYHPANFYKAEPMFGSFAELKDLIDTAHSNGVYVVLDVVVNHMADLLKYADCNCNYEGYCDNNCAGLAYWNNAVQFGAPFNNPALFHNNGTIGDNDWDTYPRYVRGAFLGTEDLKTEDPFVQNELRWAFKNLIDATDCDGFRVDAIKHMEYDFIKQWADDMRVHAATRGKTNFILFGEYFSYDDNTQASYCKDVGYSFNSTLWFPMQLTLKNVFAFEQGTDQLVTRMNALALYGEATERLVAFMDNHDVDRIALECGSSWEAKLRPALTFLYATMPVPCLYYGTEQGFDQGGRRNGSPKLGQADFQRECMMNYGFQWGNAAGDDFVQSPLYLHIKKLNEVRAQYPSLRRGTRVQRWSEGGKGLFALSRMLGNEEALIAINTDSGSKSMNPQVAKPNGTVFVNALDPAETVTVSGGRLAFAVGGKGSKIFVAGLGNATAETGCNGVTLTITYKPNGGPLAAPVGNVHIGIGHDGNVGVIDAVMTKAGSDWVYGYALSNATNDVTFWFHDESAGPIFDNNNNQNWNVVTRECGSPSVDLAWIGNVTPWPAAGEWDGGEAMWVNIESYPKTAAIDGFVVYSADGGATWSNKALSINGAVGNNDAWNANLGAWPGGATLRYAVSLRGRNGVLWANNSNLDYTASVNLGTSVVAWVGNVAHWPENGSIEPGNDLWVNAESWPIGAGVTGAVVYSTDGGASWQARELAHSGTVANNDWWHGNLGPFAAEATVRYAVMVRDGNGTDHWDNFGGSNFVALINAASSSLRWFGNTIQGGAPRPELGLGLGTGGVLQVAMDALVSNAQYTLLCTTDFVTWSNVVAVAPAGTDGIFNLATAPGAPTNAFYRLRLDWTPGPAVYTGAEAVISIETWPIGGASGATLVYALNGSSNWMARAMQHTGTRGNNDIWSASLGQLPLGTVIRYSVEVMDDHGQSHWDNNGGQDHQFHVLDPNVTDHAAPVTGYAPSNTVTAAATLDVTLTAVDDQDPAPAIYYTTNGAAPTVASAVYGAAIHVTDAGSGVDRTIKFFARDATGNSSGITTVEVKVNQTFTPGGNTPYATNPTLGHSVPNGSITANGVNNGEWNDTMLIALDMANDDPRTLGGNWTTHEAPIDLTHLWAAWDDTKLYLAWQYVDVTDKIDGNNAGSAGGGRINHNDGILQWIAIDTKSGGAGRDMWGKNHGSNYWTGVDLPDVQIYLAGSLWQGYLSRAVGGVFPVDDGGVNYFTMAGAGIARGTSDSFAGTTLLGVGDADERHAVGAPNRNFIAEGHATSRDSFYEIAIPFAVLQITRAQLESGGIGVMLGAGSVSAMDSLPHDETTVNTPGVESYNSSFEWSDTDAFTAPFTRVGAVK